MSIQRDSIVFYRSFYEAIQMLAPNDQLEIFHAILELGLNGEEVELCNSNVAKAIFLLIKPQIIANNERYVNSQKGGRPLKKTDNKQEDDNNKKPIVSKNCPKQKPMVIENDETKKPMVTKNGQKQKPNENVNVNENDNDNDNGNDNVNEKGVTGGNAQARGTHKTSRHIFVKPTVSEIADYCRKRNNGVNAEKFFDFYESKGWLVGKTPMKDWKACVRTWEQRDITTGELVKLACVNYDTTKYEVN